MEYEATDHIVPWNVLKARCKKGGLKLTERDLDLVVCYLQRERKVSVHVTNEGEKVHNEIAVQSDSAYVLQQGLNCCQVKNTTCLTMFFTLHSCLHAAMLHANNLYHNCMTITYNFKFQT